MSMPPLLDDELSSPPSDISSPPSSPPQTVADTITVALRRSGEGVATPASALSAQPAVAHTAASHNTASSVTLPSTIVDSASKPKRQRKPKEPKDAKAPGPVKEKKTRKPREPKVKKDGDGTTAAPRKRQKTEEMPTPGLIDINAGFRQPTLLEVIHPNQQSQPQYQPASLPPPPRPPQQAMPSDPISRSSLPPRTSNPPTPRPYSSGQNYDPIRGSTIDDAPPRPPAAVAAATTTTTTTTTTNGALSTQASPQINRASASPSIISLIDPPGPTTKPAGSTQSSHSMQITSQPQHQVPQPPPSFLNTQPSPTPPRAPPKSPPPTTILPSQHSPIASKPMHSTTTDGAMDIDGPVSDAPSIKPPPQITVPSKSSSSSSSASASASAAPAPKPPPAKVNSPPKATGSGLLSSSDLLGGPASSQGGDRKGIDIEIRIQLNPNGGNTINIAQEIAKKYGRDAVNPRAAAHRERLLQVAAAANRLEGGLADDMSVDLISEAEGDSNIEMGGMDEEKSATGAEEKPKKRRKKVEEYDKEDDFIDDTELAWQQQAAVAKDGFFVYSGPLIPEGQSAQVESSTSTRGRGGGRGRGRGRGGGGGGAAAAAAASATNGTTHASPATEKKEAGAAGRGRGRGRGTGAPRKPRITKADRERMEAEKADRGRLAANPNAIASTAPTAPIAPTASAAPAAPIAPTSAPTHPAAGQVLAPPTSTTYAGSTPNTYNPQTTTQGGVTA